MKKSIRAKIIVVIVFVVVVCAGVAVGLSYRQYAQSTDEFYKTYASDLAEVAAQFVDGDTLPEYISDREPDAEYEQTLENLREFKDHSGIAFLYVHAIDGDELVNIYETDENPDTMYIFRDRNPFSSRADRTHMEEGIPAFITNTADYGWLVSVYKPVFDSKEQVVGLVGVDVSMQTIVDKRHSFLILLLCVIAGAALALIGASVVLGESVLVKPIVLLANAARNFASGGDTADEKETLSFDVTGITNEDEIGTLRDSLLKMEEDIDSYINNLTQITAEKERIGAELNVATQIQASMLPRIFPAFPERDEFDIYASMNPAKEVGGDFYDFFLIDEDHLGLVMADVSGKGVPAALFMMIAKTLLKTQCMFGKSPKEVAEVVNNQLCENNEAEMFVTVWLGIMEISTGKVTAINAGHEYPAIYRPETGFELLKDKHGFVMAGMEGARYREYEFNLAKGDVLFLYTDGVAEATSAATELFGTDRMLEALNGTPEKQPKALVESVSTAIDTFVDAAPQFDDITMLAVRIN